MNISLLVSLATQSDSLARVNRIVEFVNHIARNTEPDPVFNSVSFWASVFTIVGTLLGVLAIWSFLREYSQDRIDQSCQISIFNDLIRHFYRNKVIILAMKVRYIERSKNVAKGGDFYISQEHYRKLQVLPDDLHLERFHRRASIFMILHELHLLLRNFNIEVDTYLEHVIDPRVCDATILRDFDCLNYKCGTITKRIKDILDVIEQDKDNNDEDGCWDIILNKDSVKKGVDGAAPIVSNEMRQLITAEVKKLESYDKYFVEILKPANHKPFMQKLIADVVAECREDSTYPSQVHVVELK